VHSCLWQSGSLPSSCCHLTAASLSQLELSRLTPYCVLRRLRTKHQLNAWHLTARAIIRSKDSFSGLLGQAILVDCVFIDTPHAFVPVLASALLVRCRLSFWARLGHWLPRIAPFVCSWKTPMAKRRPGLQPDLGHQGSTWSPSPASSSPIRVLMPSQASTFTKRALIGHVPSPRHHRGVVSPAANSLLAPVQLPPRLLSSLFQTWLGLKFTLPRLIHNLTTPAGQGEREVQRLAALQALSPTPQPLHCQSSARPISKSRHSLSLSVSFFDLYARCACHQKSVTFAPHFHSFLTTTPTTHHIP
jgi:hypothetical protein